MNHAQAVRRQQLVAFAWEFWAHAWKGLLLGLAVIISLGSLIYSALSAISDISFNRTEVGTTLHFGLFWLAIFSLGAPIVSAWGVPRRRYVLPSSSLMIVACPMVCSMLSMFVLYAIAAATLNLLYDAGWTIWGPGMLAAVSIAWLQAIVWSTSNSKGLRLISCVTSFVMLWVLIMNTMPPGHISAGWFNNGLDESKAAALGLAALLCVGLGTVGFANLRQGRGLNFGWFVDLVGRIFPATACPRTLATPATAQFWLEWKERGYALPVCTAFMGVVAVIIARIAPPPDPTEFVSGMTAMLLWPTLLVGFYLGSRSDKGDFGNFNGSRPLSDTQIANAVLTSVTVGVLSSALIWVAVLAVVSWIVGQDISLPDTVEREWALRLLGISTLAIGGAWGLCSLVTSIVLAGKKVTGVVIGTLIGAFMLGGLLPKLRLPSEIEFYFKFLYVWSCLLLPPAVVAKVYVIGWKKKLISRSTLALAAGIAAVMFASGYLAGLIQGTDSLVGILWGCCLTPSALAVAPLAVWWNRHR